MIDKKVNQWLLGATGKGKQGGTANGYGLSVLGDENMIKLGNGNDYIIQLFAYTKNL